MIFADGARIDSVPLTRETAVLIGRGQQCDCRVGGAAASREHAVLHVNRWSVEIEDLGSRNGTWLRGERLPSRVRTSVADGEPVRIGSAVLLLQKVPEGRGEPVAHKPPVMVSAAMREVRTLIARVARGSINVLFLGETGVGKEVMARLLHEESSRADRPFVVVNCPAVPENLIESELFGHVKGAFTGAADDKVGLVEAADGGTLFLDEVGELPLAMQAKLLRLLEDARVQPIGARSARPVDVRFVAATNRDLDAEVARGAFRADLYYRLGGISVEVPPLRERREDIEALAWRFLQGSAQLLGLAAPPELAPAALARLMEHDWPGNVRELRNCMERAVLLAAGEPIEPHHLLDAPPGGRDSAAQLATSTVGATVAPQAEAEPDTADLQGGDRGRLRDEMDELERKRIIDALGHCAGNQTRAAELLGISRRTLGSKLDKYGIGRPRKR
jgi:DNA-binding NtrC family response regulator